MSRNAPLLQQLYVCAVGLLSALSFSPVYATSEEQALFDLYGSAEMISIATGTLRPVKLAPAVTHLITAQDIERSGATDIFQLLETVPGIHIYPSPLNRMTNQISIRGMQIGQNPQVLVLLDGVRLKFAFNGGLPPNFMFPVHLIERIEVMRGPGSAVYGADAYSGVINIITKRAEHLQGFSGGVRGGNFNDHDAWLQLGTQLGDNWFAALSLEEVRSHQDSANRMIEADQQTAIEQAFAAGGFLFQASDAPGSINKQYKLRKIHLNAHNEYWNVRAWQWQLLDAGVGAGAAQALDSEYGLENIKSRQIDIQYDSGTLYRDWQYSVTASYNKLRDDVRFKLFPDGAYATIGWDGNIFPAPDKPELTAYLAYFPNGIIGEPDVVTYQRSLQFSLSYRGWKHHQIRLGMEAYREQVHGSERKNFGPGILEPDRIGDSVFSQPVYVVTDTLTDVTNTPYVYIPDVQREVYAISLQDEWELASDWSLTAGLRYDHFSAVGDSLNPRLALVWNMNYNLTAKLLYGEAFRAPSIDTLYAQNNPVILGNPDLSPEQIRTTEMVLLYQPTSLLELQLSLFHYDARDLIEYVAQGNGSSVAQNAGQQRGEGFEAEMDWDLNADITLSANYAFQRSEDSETGQTIADAPKNQFYANLDWYLGANYHLFNQINWVMNRERAAGDSRAAIDDYATWDLTLRKKALLSGLDASLTVRNVFDADVREPAPAAIPGDYPMEGRHWMVGLYYRY